MTYLGFLEVMLINYHRGVGGPLMVGLQLKIVFVVRENLIVFLLPAAFRLPCFFPVSSRSPLMLAQNITILCVDYYLSLALIYVYTKPE